MSSEMASTRIGSFASRAGCRGNLRLQRRAAQWACVCPTPYGDDVAEPPGSHRMRAIVEALPLVGLFIAIVGLIWPRLFGGLRRNGVVLGLCLSVFSMFVSPSLRSEAEQADARLGREAAAAERDRLADEARVQREREAAERVAAQAAAAAQDAAHRAAVERDRLQPAVRAADVDAPRGPDTLRMPGGNTVFVWRSSDAQREAFRLVNAGVHNTNPALLLPYISCTVPNGTAVVVVDGGFFSSIVLVREGRFSGCRGVVENEWINRPR